MNMNLKRRWRKLSATVLIAALLIFNLPLTAFAAKIDTFQQFANTNLQWINGNVNQNKSHYVEGMSNPQRLIVRGLTDVSQSITFAYQFTKGGYYAYDFITSWSQAMMLANTVGNQTWLDSWKWIGTDEGFWTAPTANHYSVNVPDDPHATSDRITAFEGALGYGNRTIDIYANGTLDNPRITIDSTLYGSTASDSQVYWSLLWDGGTATDIMVLYAGHLAIGLDFPSTNIGWGSGKGAGGISGSPYHQMIKAATEFTPGSQDNQMSAAAIDLKSGISGYKWHDRNANGVWDAGEEPLSGWTIWVDFDNDGVADATDVTDSNGFYELYFTLPTQTATTVHVYEILQTGWRQTYPAAGYNTATATPGYATENINFGNAETTSVTVVKAWNDADNQDGIRPASVSVQLKADGVDVGSPVVLNSGNSWTYTWNDLPKFAGTATPIDYTIVETPVPTGYTVGYSVNDAGAIVVTNTHIPETTSVTVVKAWNDADNQDGIRPASVSVQLKADGVDVGSPVVLNSGNSWTYTWNDLPKFAGTATPIDYTIVETPVPTGYTVGYSVNDAGAIVVTNTHIPETTSVTVVKAWNDADNQDGIRPASVSVQLKADGVDVGSPVVLNSGNSWTYTWNDLPKFAGTATPIDYTIVETPVPTGYTVGYSVNDAGAIVVTNTHIPEITSVTVVKAWNDADNQDGIRPASVSVQLKADGVDVGSPVVLDSGNSWTYTWSNLPKYAGTATPIVYSVVETPVPAGYTVGYSVNDAGAIVVTNTHIPETTSVTVVKAWNDADNQDGIRPASVSVQLKAGGVDVGSPVVLNSGNSWTYTWSNLPKYAGTTTPIAYTVVETPVPTGYTVGYSVNDAGAIVVTNTHIPETTSVTVVKAWNDADNQDGIRPAGVLVQLKADGSNYGSPMALNSGNSWTYTWSNLPKYAGTTTPIVYTVEETPVPTGYTVGYSVNDAGAIVVTNTHIPETTSVTVVKAWNDADNQDGIRPASVSVQLKANGVDVGSPVVLDSGNSWTYTWSVLPKYAGTTTPIDYTIVETPVPTGYTVGYSVNDAGAIVVTNTHIPETTSVSVLKIWDDFQDIYGLRPLGISVQLLQDGSPYGAPVLLNNVNSWAHTWNDLPGKNIGVPYTYTVAEITAVPGYTTAYGEDDGVLTITNTLKTFFIELVKLDARDETTPLAGATFELRSAVDDNGSLVPGALLETLTTDAAGKAKTAAAYGPGSYFLVETVAPDGFHLLDAPVLVELDPDGESGSTVTVTLYDEFIHEPDLTISKLVANLTTGSPPAELSEAIVGQTVQYTVVVTNTGNVTLTNVILTDDEALIGSAVTIVGQGETTWIAGPGGLAAVNLGDMAPGASITLIYDYAVVAADLSREPIINTATATGTMLPTSDYPDGAVLQVSDTAIVTVDDIPLSLAAISLTKRVQNLTQGGVPAELAGGYVGDVFRYTVTITNTGEEPLSLVTLTDDLAPAGGAVRNVTASTDHTWMADGSNPVYLDLGDLAPGASVTLTYDYTSVNADIELVKINTAHVIATATVTLDKDEQVTVEDEDTAAIAVDEIPQTGESGTWPVWGIGLLLAALGLTVLRRRNRKSGQNA